MIYAPSAGPTLVPSLPSWPLTLGGGGRAQLGGKEEGKGGRPTGCLSIPAWIQHLPLVPPTPGKA